MFFLLQLLNGNLLFYKRMKEEEEEERCSEPACKAVLDSKIILKLEFLNLCRNIRVLKYLK